MPLKQVLVRNIQLKDSQNVFSSENFVKKIEKLNGGEINAKMVSGNFAADAFTTAAFSMRFIAITFSTVSIAQHKVIFNSFL